MKWRTATLGQIATIVGGSTPSRDREEYWNGSVFWLTPTDLPKPGEGIAEVTETTSKITEGGLAAISAQLLPVGTVLFSSRATIGKLGISRVPLTTNQGFANFIPKKIVDAKYLACCLRYFTNSISALAGSTTFKEVTKSALKKFKIPLPPISEQRRIIEILDQADRLRKLRADADAKSQRILPALFIKMFGDLATNPKGWKVGTLGDVCERITDGTHQPPQFVENGIPFLFVQNIVKGFINFNTQKFITEETYKSLTKTIAPQKGDILYSTVGSYGVAVVVDTNRLFLFQRHIGHLRPKGALMDSWFLCAQMNTPYVKAQADQRARGLAQKTLNLSEIRQFQVIIPPLVEQKKFRLAMQNLEKITGRVNDQEILIESLFKIILNRAFTGDLTASWREANIKELLQEMELQAKALAS